ncbi:MAG: hypothetical protein QMD94_00535, partial [Candidatus Omnitrophota bacterium]|nr:hypothetical protein [Candidatus Omnitrophota bacterium]
TLKDNGDYIILEDIHNDNERTLLLIKDSSALRTFKPKSITLNTKEPLFANGFQPAIYAAMLAVNCLVIKKPEDDGLRVSKKIYHW